MWQELIKNEVWYTENFLDESLVDYTLDKIRKSDTKVLDANEQPHIISKSHYNYNHVKYNIREDKLVLAQVIVRLNEVLSKVYKRQTLPKWGCRYVGALSFGSTIFFWPYSSCSAKANI